MEQFVLSAEPRTQFGSRAVSILRKSGKIPGNIYGHAEANLHVSLDSREFSKFLEAGHRIVTIRLGEKDEHSLVKEVQYDALGTSLIHVDFTRIRRDEKIEVAVPVDTVGMPRGLTGGGVLAFTHKEVLVSGFPQDIPEHYILNIEALELGQIIRLKDLTPPPNCVFVEEPEIVVVSIVHQRVEAAPVPVEALPAQPEVIGKKKEEPAEGEEPEAKKKEKEK
ncbi:MAG TPA: 50S ribosomal protein L25 [Planctomycetota bacterium]|nr:50S ribosomal protein L25 [Planctomycetota bacterium]